MAADWLNIGSAQLHSKCGEDPSYLLADALDGLNVWYHDFEGVHWFILDLGQSYTITKVKGRSNYPAMDPYHLDIYVSDDIENWGAAVKTNIDLWRTENEFIEYDVTEKSGRYIKVVILDTMDAQDRLVWGRLSVPFTIFDCYGEPPPAAYSIDKLRKDVRTGYHCFMAAYLGAKIEGATPLKLPDGTTF